MSRFVRYVFFKHKKKNYKLRLFCEVNVYKVLIKINSTVLNKKKKKTYKNKINYFETN